MSNKDTERELYDAPDQWHALGRCEVCRKRAYCSHVCTAHKNAVYAMVCQALYSKLAGKGEK